MDFITPILRTLGVSAKEEDLAKPAPRSIYTCGHRSPYDFTLRTRIDESELAIFGWPSRGGVIILEEADAIDFEHLDMDPLDPVLNRAEDQAEEDIFCQRLLLLGAKWWDSAERYFYVQTVCRDQITYGHGDGSFKSLERPDPTIRESSWIKVGWPSSGGLWVSEFVPWGQHEDAATAPPEDGLLGRVRMARTMNERCKLLELRLCAKFYKDVSEYNGMAFLTAWEWKISGEAGSLLTPKQTFDEWRNSMSIGKIDKAA